MDEKKRKEIQELLDKIDMNYKERHKMITQKFPFQCCDCKGFSPCDCDCHRIIG